MMKKQNKNKHKLKNCKMNKIKFKMNFKIHLLMNNFMWAKILIF